MTLLVISAISGNVKTGLWRERTLELFRSFNMCIERQLRRAAQVYYVGLSSKFQSQGKWSSPREKSPTVLCVAYYSVFFCDGLQSYATPSYGIAKTANIFWR